MNGRSGTSNISSSSGKMLLCSLSLYSCPCCCLSNLPDLLISSSTWGKRSSTTVPAKRFAGSRRLNARFSSRPAGFCEDFENDLVEAFDREEFVFGFFLRDRAAGPGSDFRLPAGILTIESSSFTSSSQLLSPCKYDSVV